VHVLAQFREFIARGNVIDLAVGIIIGSAFTSVVKSLVDDIVMPPIGVVTGGVDFSNLFLNLSSEPYVSLAEAKKVGAATVNYGVFLNNVVSFMIVAFCVFLMVQSYQKLRERSDSAPPPPSERDCQYCKMRVPIAAVRCGHCTSDLAR
jgi:large conductance mechanosensitive channel